jgi:hypothetical protein
MSELYSRLYDAAIGGNSMTLSALEIQQMITSTCPYCGLTFPNTPGDFDRHTRSCQKHPLFQAVKLLAEFLSLPIKVNVEVGMKDMLSPEFAAKLNALFGEINK